MESLFVFNVIERRNPDNFYLFDCRFRFLVFNQGLNLYYFTDYFLSLLVFYISFGNIIKLEDIVITVFSSSFFSSNSSDLSQNASRISEKAGSMLEILSRLL